jgi:Flp pilus assembly protein TadG
MIAKNLRRSERGQSLGELSIVMTLVLVLLAGVADGGRAFFTYISLRDAAQEGALYGSFVFSQADTSNNLIDPGTACSQITARVMQNSDNPVDLSSDASILVQIEQASNPGVWVDCTSTISIQPCVSDRIRVAVTYPDFTLSTPFLGAVIGTQTVDISASVEDIVLAPAGSQTSACP